ncbi:MAG: hypothetical protein HUU60_12550 [Armatimonadetes bacterium]|nr:hypothetical protein [Armatimonadota bacterium]
MRIKLDNPNSVDYFVFDGNGSDADWASAVVANSAGEVYVGGLSVVSSDGSVRDMVSFKLKPNGDYVGSGVRIFDGYGPQIGTVSFFTVPLFGDANEDDCVDDTDQAIVPEEWGQQGSGLAGDVNGDGIVDDTDLDLVRLQSPPQTLRVWGGDIGEGRLSGSLRTRRSVRRVKTLGSRGRSPSRLAPVPRLAVSGLVRLQSPPQTRSVWGGDIGEGRLSFYRDPSAPAVRCGGLRPSARGDARPPAWRSGRMPRAKGQRSLRSLGRPPGRRRYIGGRSRSKGPGGSLAFRQKANHIVRAAVKRRANPHDDAQGFRQWLL